MIIIADGGHKLSIRRECYGRIWPAILAVAAKKLRRQMRRVRSAAAIAAHQEFVSGTQATYDHFGCPFQRPLKSRQFPSGSDALVNGLLQESHIPQSKRVLKKAKSKS